MKDGSDRERRLGARAVARGWIRAAGLERAIESLRERQQAGEQVSLGRHLVELGLLEADQVRVLLAGEAKAVPATDAAESCATLLVAGETPAPPGTLAPTLLEPARPATGPEGGIRLAGGPRIEGQGAFGRYSNAEEMARGGMGAIYRAIDPELGRPVAIKAILGGASARSRNLVARFEREAQITGQLQHPNIPPVHELARGPGGDLYFTMKLIEGRSLDDIVRELSREGPAALARERHELLRALIKVCDALAYAHSRGVIHRDLKPDNIMVGEFGEVLVMDWGIAKVLGTSDVEVGQGPDRRGELDPLRTLEGAVMGTPSFMSPEQAAGRVEEIDPRSDVYSLGAVIYDVLTGTPPYVGRSFEEIATKVETGDRESPSRRRPEAGIPPELDRLVEKALATKPARRYGSVAALRSDLEAYLAERPISAYRYTRRERIAKWVRRNRAVSAVAAASLTVILVVLVALAVAVVRATRGEALARHELRQRELWEAEAEMRARSLETSGEELEMSQRAVEASRRAAERERAFATAQRLLFEVGEETGFLPARPERRATYDRWIAEAEALVRSRADHARVMSRLGLQTVRDEGDEVALVLEKAILASLDELERFLPDVRCYADVAGRLEGLSEAWPEAVRSIRAGTGLSIGPVPELVPLGRDPRSGHWEFEHVPTARAAPRGGPGRPMTADRGLVLVLIPGGTFRMGSDVSGDPPEGPVHDVSVPAFLLSKYEVTRAQWKRAAGERPDADGLDPCRAQEHVSWDEATRVLRRMGLRLPTEAEWEYAARAGTTTPWWTGDDPRDLATAANLADQDDGAEGSCPVGRYLANAFGLHDTIGNVWEWCEDTYQPDYAGAPTDGSAWVVRGAALRVARGGCASNRPVNGRSADRDGYGADRSDLAIGLRPAMRIP